MIITSPLINLWWVCTLKFKMLHGLNLKSLSRPIFPSLLYFLIWFRKLTPSIQFSHSIVSDSVTPWTSACQACLSITNSWSLIKFMSTESVMSSNHLILCCPLLPPSIFPRISVFQMSQFFASGGQSIGVSASKSVLTMNIQEWFSSGWTGLISLKSNSLSRVFSNTTVQKHQFFGAQLSL